MSDQTPKSNEQSSSSSPLIKLWEALTLTENPDSFYQSGTSSNVPSPAQANLNKLFDNYRGKYYKPKDEPDRIGIDGAQRYLSDLGIALDEVAHLALCELLQCSSIGEFEREKFVSGWRTLLTNSNSSGSSPNPTSYDTIARQVGHVNNIRRRLASDPAYFKDIYKSTFKLAKPDNQKSVPMESALEFWTMFFGGRARGGVEWNNERTAWLDLWLEFYETKTKRPVNKDLWNMVGELVIRTKEPGGEDLEWWSENGAWPMAVDEYVEFVLERRKGGVENMDTS